MTLAIDASAPATGDFAASEILGRAFIGERKDDPAPADDRRQSTDPRETTHLTG
jgi:hypothetical protein